MMGMAASLAKFKIGLPKRIFVQIEEASKANLCTFGQLVVTLILPKKTKSKATKI